MGVCISRIYGAFFINYCRYFQAFSKECRFFSNPLKIMLITVLRHLKFFIDCGLRHIMAPFTKESYNSYAATDSTFGANSFRPKIKFTARSASLEALNNKFGLDLNSGQYERI